jgi:hypothetical protein
MNGKRIGTLSGYENRPEGQSIRTEVRGHGGGMGLPGENFSGSTQA